MTPIIVSCKASDWKNVLKVNLQDGIEADLTNFDYTIDGHFCELLAVAHSMRFKLDAKNSTGFFRLISNRGLTDAAVRKEGRQSL
jgi:hypothetical protein